MVLFGAGLGLFFGWLWVGALLDDRALPSEPRPISVADAAALAEPPRGSWVRVEGARLDCRFPPRAGFSGSTAYGFLTDETGAPRLLVAFPRALEGPCEERLGTTFVGVLRASTPGRIVGLDFPGIDWNAWPTRHLTVLNVETERPDSASNFLLLVIVPLLISAFAGVQNIRAAMALRVRGPALVDAAFVMPLSTGGSAMALFGGGLVIVQLIVFGPLFVAKHLPEWTVYPIGVLWAVWLFAIVGGLIDGWRRRASDLHLGRDALLVHAGPLHRTRIAFRDIEAARFRLETAEEKGIGDDRASFYLDDELACVCRDEEEERSLAALTDTLHALGAQARGERRPRTIERPPGVITCGACMAPVAPSADEEVACGHCRAPVRMPAAAREQMAAEIAVSGARDRTERLLRRLLRQPGARRTNLLLAVAIPPLLLGWPLAAILFDEMYQARHRFAWHHGVSLFVAALSFTYGLSWLVRAQVVGRAAVRLVATRFAAVPPEAPGEPPCCRECGAPLPTRGPEQLVAVCAYCRAENVLGTNLLPVARVEGGQARDLAAELDARLAQRRRYRLVSLASLVLLALAAASLAPVWRTLRG